MDIIRLHAFGSAVTEHFTRGSDVDLALIFSDREALKTTKPLAYEKVRGAPHPCDLLFFTLEEFEQKRTFGGVCVEIDKTGRVLFDKGTKV